MNNYLVGKCLVSMPDIETDECFGKSVVYICTHNKEGAMGFVINKQLEDFYFSDLADQLEMEDASMVEPIVLHRGGPLERVRGFVLHSSEYVQEGTVVVDDMLSVSSSMIVLNDIAFGIGPQYNLIALGYSKWEQGQLEREIISNKWLVVDATPELLFKTRDEDKWQVAVDSLGFDISRISPKVGRA